MKTKHLLLPLLFVFATAAALAEENEGALELRYYEPQQYPREMLERALQNKSGTVIKDLRITSVKRSYTAPVVDLIPYVDQYFYLNLEGITEGSKIHNFTCVLIFWHRTDDNGNIAYFPNCTSDDDSTKVPSFYLNKRELGLVEKER